MLNLARQLVAGEVGAIVAARELNTFHDVVEPEIRAILDTFVGIDSETDALPLADEVRQLWDPDALEAKDALIAEAERHWHDRAVAAANRLIFSLADHSL
jgi:hypothetical protein